MCDSVAIRLMWSRLKEEVHLKGVPLCLQEKPKD